MMKVSLLKLLSVGMADMLRLNQPQVVGSVSPMIHSMKGAIDHEVNILFLGKIKVVMYSKPTHLLVTLVGIITFLSLTGCGSYFLPAKARWQAHWQENNSILTAEYYFALFLATHDPAAYELVAPTAHSKLDATLQSTEVLQCSREPESTGGRNDISMQCNCTIVIEGIQAGKIDNVEHFVIIDWESVEYRWCVE